MAQSPVHDPTPDELKATLAISADATERENLIARAELGRVVAAMVQKHGLDPVELTYTNIWKLKGELSETDFDELHVLREEGNHAYHKGEVVPPGYKMRVEQALKKHKAKYAIS